VIGRKKGYILSLLCLVAILVVFAITPWDYNISVALINEDSWWAEFFNRFGELPSNAALLLGTTILVGCCKKESNPMSRLFYGVGVLLMLAFSLYTVYEPMSYTYSHSLTEIPIVVLILAFLLGLSIFLGLLYWTFNKDHTVFENIKKEAITLLLVAVVSIALVNILKITWARPRMRSIDSIDDFRYWFQLNPFTNNNELKSFPSGHTANGMVMIVFVIFTPYINWLKRKPFIVFAVIWGILGALARIVLGAHFFTDVIVSLYITLFSFSVIYSLVFNYENIS